MLKGAIALLGLVAVLTIIAPALAAAPQDEVPITCKMVDTAEAARLLGAPLGPPQFENIVVCAGLCPWHNAEPQCSFAVANPAGHGLATRLSIFLGLAPFDPGDWSKILYRMYKPEGPGDQDVRILKWRGGVALWDFTPSTGWALLDVFTGSRAHPCAQLMLSLDGIHDDRVALDSARRLARHALERLARATPEEMVLPSWAKRLEIEAQTACVNKKGAG